MLCLCKQLFKKLKPTWFIWLVKSLAIILPIFITFTFLICYILSRILNVCQQPLTCQMVTIRIKQLNEINNYNINDKGGDFMTPWPDNSTNGNWIYDFST